MIRRLGALAVTVLVFASALTLMRVDGAEASGPTTLGVTPWQVAVNNSLYTNPYGGGVHGHPSEFAGAPAIPAVGDPAWVNCGPTAPFRSSPYSGSFSMCPNQYTIGLGGGSIIPGYICWSYLNFTYFQALVSIPAGTTINSFSVDMSGADDGAQIVLFNSLYPGGVVPAGGNIYEGTPQSTANLVSYVAAGEVNRVVIQQVDDCAVGNNLNSAKISLNGTVVPPAPTADLSITKTGPASVQAGSNINYSLTVTNPSSTAVTGATVSDPLPPSVKFISAPGCTHDGSLSGGVVTCSGIAIPANGSAPIALVVQALTVGTVLNTASITGTGNVLDGNAANNQSSATTTVTDPPPPPAPPFTLPGTLPSASARICMPPYMDQDQNTQFWWARAAGGSNLRLTLFAIGVNAAEAGSVTMKVYDPANTLVGTATVAHPPVGQAAATPVTIAAPASGTLYRLETKVTGVVGSPVARHYSIHASGATLLGMNSTTQAQAEHDDVNWKVNVAAGEPLQIDVLPGVEAALNTGTLRLIPPTGGAPAVTVALTAAGGTATVASPAAGQWTVSVTGLDGHYLLRKVGGGDTGIYLGWDSWGKGGPISVTVLNVAGLPNTFPVALELQRPDGTVQSIPSVLDSWVSPSLGLGTYLVRMAGQPYGTGEVVHVTCGEPASVTLRLPNLGPFAKNDSASTNEDTPVIIDVLSNDSDPDGGTLTVTGATPGAKGTTVVNGDGTVTYTPNPDANGTDTFTYTIADGQGGTATATVTVTIAPVQDPPVARPDSATTNEDVPVTIPVLGNDSDPDGDTLTITLVTQGVHGTVTIVGNQVQYAPAANWSGTDTFTYTIEDGQGGTATATVTVTVNPVNDPPVAVNDTASTNAGFPVTVAVLTNDSDIDGGPLTVASVTQGANGSVTVNGGSTVTYTPNPGFSGTDTFTYTVSDGNGGTAVATVTVTVIPVADASRMTGGGSIDTGKGKDAKRWTWGFEVRCDASQGNFQYQDHTGGNFHMTKVVSAYCVDDPAVGPGVPKAGFDTLRLIGTGRWNGVDGYTIEATIVDAGEPGTRDTIAITVKTAGGAVVSTVSGSLSGGNHQAHK